MKIAAFVLAIVLAAAPSSAFAKGRHGLFGGRNHGHSINAWMGSHRPRLR